MTRRRLVGPLLTALGVLHIGTTPLLHGDAVRSLLAGGVLGAVEADPELSDLRNRGFWFATTGVGLVALGVATTERERLDQPLPVSLPVTMLAMGLWGAAQMPRSPFWALVALAGLAERDRRRARSRVPGR